MQKRWSGSCALIAVFLFSMTADAQDQRGGGTRESNARQPRPAQQARVQDSLREELAAQPLSPDARLVVVRLQHVDARSLANVVNELLATIHVPGRAIVEPSTNALILVAADEAGLQRMQDVIAQLDQPGGGGRDGRALENAYESYSAENMEAARIASMLQNLTLARNPQFRVQVDQRTNRIWFFGDEQTVAQLKEVAALMDQSAAGARAPETDSGRKLSIFPVKHAEPRELGKTLNQVVGAMDMEFEIIADPFAGVCIAYVTPAESAKIAELIGKLDVQPAQPKQPAANGARGTRGEESGEAVEAGSRG